MVLKFSELFSSFFLIFWVIAYVWLLLFAYDRLTGVWRVDLSRDLSANHLHQHCRQVHTLIISLFIPSFYALVTTLKHCMSRISLHVGFWEVDDEVEPITSFIIKPLGVTSTHCLYYHAMLVDVVWVWVIFMTDVSCLLMVQLKVATKTHIWVDWGTWRTQCCMYFWISRSTRVIILWTATQAQRDHKIIHARNFRVQPQAIMGSSIVE